MGIHVGFSGRRQTREAMDEPTLGKAGSKFNPDLFATVISWIGFLGAK